MMADDADKVVSLRTGEPISLEPREDVIKLAEDLLAAARSGDVVGMTVARLHRDDSTSYERAGDTSRALFGATVLLEVMVAKHLTAREE